MTVLAGLSTPAVADQGDLAVEKRIVDYLKQNVKSGQRLIVSDLYNKVFTSPEERKVLDRLFNTFFKIPLFIAQYKMKTGRNPALADISRQFNFPIEGEAAILLTLMESDPRIPKFIERDTHTGEITSVDVEAIKADRRFGKSLERTMAGWAGKDAPPFTLDLFDGTKLSTTQLEGKNYLLYFWFSGCPPCVKISPHLVQLQKTFGKRNFTVIAVNADRFLELETTDQDRAAYVKKAGFTFPLGHLNPDLMKAFGNISVYPTLFLVNSDGMVQKQYVNYQTYEVLAKDVAALLQ
jgi:thiol-disulfide isomerase/thioredoxin